MLSIVAADVPGYSPVDCTSPAQCKPPLMETFSSEKVLLWSKAASPMLQVLNRFGRCTAIDGHPLLWWHHGSTTIHWSCSSIRLSIIRLIRRHRVPCVRTNVRQSADNDTGGTRRMSRTHGQSEFSSNYLSFTMVRNERHYGKSVLCVAIAGHTACHCTQGGGGQADDALIP